MSEASRTGVLARGTEEKSEGDVIPGHHLHQIPILDRFEDRLSMLHNEGTVRVQFGNNLGTNMLEQYGGFGTK